MLTPEQIIEARKKLGIPLSGASSSPAAPVTPKKTPKELVDQINSDNSYKAKQEADARPGNIANGLGSFFGGNKIGESIGTQYAKDTFDNTKSNPDLTDEDRQKAQDIFQKRTGTSIDFSDKGTKEMIDNNGTFDKPSAEEILGDAGRVALNFLPFGKVADSLEIAANAANLGRFAKPAANIATGLASGYGFDVAEGAKQGEGINDVFKPGIGTVTGGIISGGLEGLNTLLSKAPQAASRVIDSLVKPLLKDFSYGKDPGRVISEEGIIANNLDDLTKKVGQRRQEVGQQIGQVVNSPEAASIRENIGDALKPIDDAIQSLSRSPRTNREAITRLMDTKADILGETVDEAGNLVHTTKLEDVNAPEMFDMKQTIANMTKFTGNHSDDQIVNKSLKQVYGNIKDALNKSLKEVGFQDIEKLNEKYADLSSAEIATKYRDKIQSRQNLLSFGSTLSGGFGALAGVLSGGGIPAGAGIGILLNEASKSAAVKTRLAALLGKIGPQGLERFATENPELFAKIRNLFPKGGSVSPGDYLYEKIKETPNKEGGFIRLPSNDSKSSQSMDDFVKNYFQGNHLDPKYPLDPLHKIPEGKVISDIISKGFEGNFRLGDPEIRPIIDTLLDNYKQVIKNPSLVSKFLNKKGEEILGSNISSLVASGKIDNNPIQSTLRSSDLKNFIDSLSKKKTPK